MASLPAGPIFPGKCPNHAKTWCSGKPVYQISRCPDTLFFDLAPCLLWFHQKNERYESHYIIGHRRTSLFKGGGMMNKSFRKESRLRVFTCWTKRQPQSWSQLDTQQHTSHSVCLSISISPSSTHTYNKNCNDYYRSPQKISPPR